MFTTPILRLTTKLKHRQHQRKKDGKHHCCKEQQQGWLHQFHSNSEGSIHALLQGVRYAAEHSREIVRTFPNGNHLYNIRLKEPTVRKRLRQWFAAPNSFSGSFHALRQSRMSGSIASDSHRLQHGNAIC